MSNYGNDEQKARYLDALEVEKTGYEARMKQAKIEGNEQGVAFFQNSIAEVDAEIAAVNSDGGESAVDDVVDTSVDAIEKATGKQLDAIAAELGYEFADGVSKVDDKRAALLESVQA